MLNEDQDPDKLLYYNRVLTAVPTNPKYEYVITPPSGQSYKAPTTYDFSNNPDADVFIVYLAIADIGNPVILIKEASLTLIFSDGPPGVLLEDVEEDFETAQAAFEDAQEEFSEVQQPLFQPPNLFRFELNEYLDYIDLANTDWTELDVEKTDEKFELAQEYNGLIDSAKSDRLAVYVRIFCSVRVLFFVQISIGYVLCISALL